MKSVILSIAIFLFAVCSSFAQSDTSSITGTVIDQEGARPGIFVTALHQPTKTLYSTITSSDGRFNLLHLRTGGPYTIRMNALGYDDYVLENISLTPDKKLNLDVRLSDETTKFSFARVAGDPAPFISDGDTSFVYAGGGKTLYLFSNNIYKFENSVCFLRGNYKVSGDSLYLEINNDTPPVTMVIDTFNKYKAVNLLSVKKNKILRNEGLHFKKNKVYIWGLPVGVPDKLTITAYQYAFEVISRLFRCTIGSDPPLNNFAPKPDYTYYLPFSRKKILDIRFYRPAREIYALKFRMQHDRLVVDSRFKAILPYPLLMKYNKKDKSPTKGT
jgi:hypothetical protein